MAEQRYASLNPDTFTQGGLLNNVDAEVTAASWAVWDYNGKSDVESPALKLTFQPMDGGNASEQYLSAGDIKDWAPTEDGERLAAVSQDSPDGLRNNTNASLFFGELAKLGFPKNRLTGVASELVGLQVHVVRKKVSRGEGISDKEILLPSQLLKLPWEKKGSGTARQAPASTSAPATGATPAPTATGTPAQPVDASGIADNIKEAVAKAIPTALDGTESVEFPAFQKKVFTLLTSLKTKEKSEALKLLVDEAFLTEQGVIRDGTTVIRMPS